MIKMQRFLLIGGVLPFLAGPASALTIVNYEPTAKKFAVTAGEKRIEIDIESGASIETECGTSCKVEVIDTAAVISTVDAKQEDEVSYMSGKLEKSEGD